MTLPKAAIKASVYTPRVLGSTFGPYRVTAHLGKGGMGDVYRAHDARLGRDVALKVLPPEFTADADRLARFEREAKVLASLNHPNIASIYGLESAAGQQCLVMELVEGENLAERLSRGAMSLDEALPVAVQMAEALEAAHERGIVHRDLKPGNVMVDGAGRVKLVDFGLAKALDGQSNGDADLANSPTMSARATQAGIILGTAPYMSPEQARGRPVDTRTDIWAFGCVLFEMLTGSAPFTGSDVAEVLSAIIQVEPAYARLPADVPPELGRLIERCLRKNPRSRLRHIGDARTLLEEIAQGPRRGPGAVSDRGPGWRQAAPWALVVALAAALAWSLSGTREQASGGVPLRRFTIDLPWDSAPNWNDFQVAISFDGTHIAYNCRDGNTVSLCLRALDSFTARPIVEGRDANDWFFSPDGEWLGVADDVGLSRVPVRGGESQVIHRWADTERAGTGFSWGTDDRILFGTASGLQRVVASSGAVESVTRIADGEEVTAHRWPSHLPDGQRALITIVHADGTETAGLVDLDSGSFRDLGIRGRGFVYVPPGWLVFQQGTTLFAAAFDPDNAARVAKPVPVIENVRTEPRVARDGTLAYVPTRGESNARLVWVDRSGRATPVAAERRDYTHLDLAPDGGRALLNLDGGSIYVLDLRTGTRTLAAQGGFPVWSANGAGVSFAARGGLHLQPADGNGTPETIVDAARAAPIVPTAWNAVTGDLAYYDHRAFEIWIRPPDGPPRRFLGGPGRKRSGRFSPDGKWMAFVSDETGEYQVYVTAYPGPGPTVAVSTRGGLSPIWSADGRELFFRLGSKVLAARMTTSQPLAFSVPEELFDGPYTLDLMGHQREDVAPDGRSFLMVQNSDDFPIVIVQNWAAELGRLVR